MLPLSGCDVNVQQQEKFAISIKHGNRLYVLSCANESEQAEWLASLLLSANATLPGEQIAGDSEAEDGSGQMKKSATIGFAGGRQNSIGKGNLKGPAEVQKPKHSFASLNPLSSIIRRSASCSGDERLGQVDLAMARER